jgi:hypothetical protein
LCPCTETRLHASGRPNSTNFPEVIPCTPFSKDRELGKQKESRIRRNEIWEGKMKGRGGGDGRGGRIVGEWPLN